MLAISKFFTILFILIVFYTRTLGDSGILYRITPCDIVGALAIGFYALSGRKLNLKFFWYVTLFIGALFIGGLFGFNIAQSMIEVLIVVFLFLVFLVIIGHFNSENGLQELIVYFALGSILASMLGFYDFFASITGLPRLFPEGKIGDIQTAFRNSGSAGAYALIALTILIPVRVSKFYNLFDLKQQRIIHYGVLATFLLLLLTGKMAAYIGFTVGFIGLLFFLRTSRAFFIALLLACLSLFVFTNLEKIAPDVAGRILSKYNTRIGVNLRGKIVIVNEDQFIGKNLRDAIDAFSDNPLTGSGIGAFAGTYQHYEVHSTYFKMIGEAGLIGAFSYLVFMIMFFKKLKFRSRAQPLQEFLYFLFPLLMGCFVSWAYSYHIRRREFWVMFAIVVIVDQLIREKIQDTGDSSVSGTL